MEPDAVLRTTVFLDTESGSSITFGESVVIGDAIWLVFEWHETQDRQWRMPGRSIRVDGLPHQRTMETGFGELLLTDAIPITVAAGHPTPAERAAYELVEGLPVRVRVPRAS